MIDDLSSYKGKSGSPCPNVHEWLEAFGDADIVFGVSITSSLSGCYGAAVQAKEGFAGGKVRIAHCLNKISASQLKATILEKYKNCDVKITECRALCSFYIEKGGIMIGFEA